MLRHLASRVLASQASQASQASRAAKNPPVVDFIVSAASPPSGRLKGPRHPSKERCDPRDPRVMSTVH